MFGDLPSHGLVERECLVVVCIEGQGYEVLEAVVAHGSAVFVVGHGRLDALKAHEAHHFSARFHWCFGAGRNHWLD